MENIKIIELYRSFFDQPSIEALLQRSLAVDTEKGTYYITELAELFKRTGMGYALWTDQSYHDEKVKYFPSMEQAKKHIYFQLEDS